MSYVGFNFNYYITNKYCCIRCVYYSELYALFKNSINIDSNTKFDRYSIFGITCNEERYLMDVIDTMRWVIEVSTLIGAILLLLSEFIDKYSIRLYMLSLIFFGVVIILLVISELIMFT